jgi:hypothetical protein
LALVVPPARAVTFFEKNRCLHSGRATGGGSLAFDGAEQAGRRPAPFTQEESAVFGAGASIASGGVAAGFAAFGFVVRVAVRRLRAGPGIIKHFLLLFSKQKASLSALQPDARSRIDDAVHIFVMAENPSGASFRASAEGLEVLRGRPVRISGESGAGLTRIEAAEDNRRLQACRVMPATRQWHGIAIDRRLNKA